MDFGGNGCKIFGLDGHTFDKRWIFLYREGDNYSISMKSFGYNPKLSLQHWILSYFGAKTTDAATGGFL